MCSRYGAAAEFNLLEKTYRVSLPKILQIPSEVIYPHRPAPVVISNQGQNEVRLMNFSLIPKWSKVRRPKFVTYNARVEEVLNKPTWKSAFSQRHCLVPMQYFIESVYEGPFAGHNILISGEGNPVLSAAGIWESWLDKESGEEVDSFAILTSEPPPDILQAGHDRCPIFLGEDSWQDWLKDIRRGEDWVQFLQKNYQHVKFQFTEGTALKSYQKGKSSN